MRFKIPKEKFIVSGERNFTVYIRGDKISRISGKSPGIKIEKEVDGEYFIKSKNRLHIGEVNSLKQNKVTVTVNGNTYHFTIETETSFNRNKKLGDSKGKSFQKIEAPLPGKVCEILVSEDQEIKRGEPIAILEAMKMQNEIQAEVDGTVKKIYVNENDSVMKEQLMFEISSAE